jgi:hypothetical protein
VWITGQQQAEPEQSRQVRCCELLESLVASHRPDPPLS